VLHPSQADVERAGRQLGLERRPSNQRDPNFAWPQITRWHFVTHLPIPGTVNQYRWRAQGELACSLDRDHDRMLRFRLEALDADKPIVLVSPVVLFDKKKRALDSEAATQVTFAWGTVQSQKAHLDLDAVTAAFDGSVVVDVDREEAPASGGANAADADEGAAAKPADKKPLRITADHFEIVTAEDKGVFTGNVQAVDSSGTIWADEMVVEYYTDEEKAADPTHTGMKRVTCTGHVRIDQKTEQAKCEKAVYDVTANVVTLLSTETTQVLYRKDDGHDKHQVLADTVVIDRNPNGKTRFVGHVEVVDFSESRESFFGEEKKDEKNEPGDNGAAGTTDHQ
jgi:lipopolysaccharide transport protein LptA